ncbi:GNAT family N-acetyltransferase [Flavobacterium sp.]|uniref:GNAT family N-acetyltransferase n=1 Tax=Flavobacterium sp. TaxID=239 RepID=UPI0008BB011D|nr:GNAT family N-acetyltransferase [Flavobacterium sp.]OGS62561.1 MAG: hypothetical protein A2X07_10275 [Flavobacteria bacterium GWF1_32_7]HBD27533.1 hypothetical protein [Flavobacterium sp.]
MLNLKINYSYKKLDANLWDNSSSATYFTSSNWHDVVLSFYHDTFLTKRLHKPVYFQASFDDGSWILGFFFVSKTIKGKTITFGHLLGPSDYYDLLYSPSITNEQFQVFFNQIQLDFKTRTMQFVHLKATSKCYQAIAQLPLVISTPLSCVAISLPETYEVYHASLSKSVRQNIRTAYNRLEKSNLHVQLEIFEKRDHAQINWEQLKQLYSSRNDFRKEKKYWKSQLYFWLDYGFQHEKDMFDFETIQKTDFTLAVLKINQEIAAYFFGFKIEKNIEINRVVINDDFKFFSPGLLLFNEYIKKEISQLEGIDLTVGDEKYKFDLGGKPHIIYNLKVSI